MKFLAIEHPVAGAAPETRRPLLKAEARRVWDLQRAGILREIYFTPTHEMLASLPLVREGQIQFEVTALLPYTGFERLFVPEIANGAIPGSD